MCKFLLIPWQKKIAEVQSVSIWFLVELIHVVTLSSKINKVKTAAQANSSSHLSLALTATLSTTNQ